MKSIQCNLEVKDYLTRAMEREINDLLEIARRSGICKHIDRFDFEEVHIFMENGKTQYLLDVVEVGQYQERIRVYFDDMGNSERVCFCTMVKELEGEVSEEIPYNTFDVLIFKTGVDEPIHKKYVLTEI